MKTLSTTEVAPADAGDIQKVLIEGVWRVDNGRAASVWELQTLDIVIRGLKPGEDVVGHDAVREWGEQRDRAPRRTRHVLTNIRVFNDANGATKASSILTMYRHEGEGAGSAAPFMVADFDDTYTKGPDGRWLLAERVITPVFVLNAH